MKDKHALYNAILEVRGVSQFARHILHVLAVHARGDGSSVFVSQARIAAETGISERKVRDAIKELATAGYLVRVGERAVHRGFLPVYRVDLDHRHGVPPVDDRPPAPRAGSGASTTGTTRRDHRHHTSRPPARRADDQIRDQTREQTHAPSCVGGGDASPRRATRSAGEGAGRDPNRGDVEALLVAFQDLYEQKRHVRIELDAKDERRAHALLAKHSLAVLTHALGNAFGNPYFNGEFETFATRIARYLGDVTPVKGNATPKQDWPTDEPEPDWMKAAQ